MDKYGLTEEEQKTNVHGYNHALFKNMMSFLDIVWEVNMRTGTVFVLENKAEPEKSGKEFLYQEVYDDYVANKVKESDLPVFRNYVAFENLRKMTEQVSLDIHVRLKGDEWSLHCVELTPAFDEDGTLYCVYMGVRDLEAEERRKREALREAYEAANHANSAKSAFLARMSHDIRTPMNAIVGMTAIASTHLNEPERVADCLEKINVSSKHLLGLINEVLDMSQIESGRVELQDEEFALPELINNMLDICRSQIEEKQHELTVNIQGIENENVIGDSQRIQESMLNLLTNAIKYTPAGGKISLTVSEIPTNKDRVGCYEFVVEDNGIGMSRDYLEHLFEPFERAEDRRVEKIQGMGLGLAITKNIIQMMNGTIEVESELDKGTKFTATIFLQLQDKDSSINYDQFAGLSVIVADDDATSCEITCALLTELGIRSEWVLTGHHAVERVVERHQSGHDYFAVLVDWRMPGMDGVDVTREIRRLTGDSIPIVILSAYDWSDIELEARAAGASGFLGKPLFKSRMVHLFHELLGNNVKENPQSSIERLAATDFSGRRALLVEDNELNAEIAEEILKMTGLEVEHASDGNEAVQMMAVAPDWYYDIVFMDIQMPVMNGQEATRAIRAMDREYTKQVPILAMSANAFAEDVFASIASGMNEHIAKPIDFNHLKEALDKWLPR